MQREAVQASLQTDPDNEELQTLKLEIDEALSATESLIAELKPKPPQEQPKKPSPTAEKPKWSIENHPAYQAGYRKPAHSPVEDSTSTPVAYKVNDTVLARWMTGDKAWYPARITSITGSSSDPVYYVTFKSYGNQEALRGPDIKPVSNDTKKRKADGLPVTSTASAASGSSSVISAAADINPALASQAKKEPSKVSDGAARPAKIARKVKAKKELEAGKSKWQDFTTKGKFGKAAKKDSMFSTGEGVNARGKYSVPDSFISAYCCNADNQAVGFTGSGQAMRKDVTRSRHIYQPGEEDNNY